MRACGNENLPNEFPRQPKEWFFEVVIRLRRNFKVLDVLLSVESHGAGLDFSLLRRRQVCGLASSNQKYLDVDLVSTKNNWNVLTDAFEIAMPVGDVLIGDAGSDVEHDNTALALNIVTVTETTELLLASCIPHVEADGAKVCGEG